MRKPEHAYPVRTGSAALAGVCVQVPEDAAAARLRGLESGWEGLLSTALRAGTSGVQDHTEASPALRNIPGHSLGTRKRS